MNTTTGAQAPTLKLTDAQMTALHSMCGGPWMRINRGVEKRLIALGAVKDNGYARTGPRFEVTAAGRAAHDAFYTPERLAAMAAAAKAAGQERARAAAEKRARVDAAVAARTAAMAELRDLLGDAAPWWIAGDAKPHNDYSGVNGGINYNHMTADELLEYVKAALANAGVQQ